jgi:hypothetical protein
MNDKPEIVKLLLDRGADINSTVSDVSIGYLVLHMVSLAVCGARNRARIRMPHMAFNKLWAKYFGCGSPSRCEIGREWGCSG